MTQSLSSSTDHSPLDEHSTYSHVDFLGCSKNKIGSFLPQGLFSFFFDVECFNLLVLKMQSTHQCLNVQVSTQMTPHTESFPAAVNTPPLPICDGQFYVLTWVGYILHLFNKTLIQVLMGRYLVDYSL